MYKLSKLRGKWHIIDDGINDGYLCKINNTKVVIMDNYIGCKLSYNDFNVIYKKLLKKILKYLDSDESDEDTSSFFINELFSLRQDLINKYSKFLSKNDLNRFLRNIRLLVSELKNKVSILNRNFSHSKVR